MRDHGPRWRPRSMKRHVDVIVLGLRTTTLDGRTPGSVPPRPQPGRVPVPKHVAAEAPELLPQSWGCDARWAPWSGLRVLPARNHRNWGDSVRHVHGSWPCGAPDANVTLCVKHHWKVETNERKQHPHVGVSTPNAGRESPRGTFLFDTSDKKRLTVAECPRASWLSHGPRWWCRF